MISMAALYTNAPTSNNATYQPLNPFYWRQDIARLDFRATDRNSIYFRWLHDNYDLVDPYGTFNASSLPNTPTRRQRSLRLRHSGCGHQRLHRLPWTGRGIPDVAYGRHRDLRQHDLPARQTD